MVSDPTTRNNVSIAYENLAKTGNSSLSTEEYLEVALEQLDSAMTGMTVENAGTESVTLSGASYQRTPLNITANGISMTQYLYLRKIDGYMVCMSVTLTTGYTVADIEAMFS